MIIDLIGEDIEIGSKSKNGKRAEISSQVKELSKQCYYCEVNPSLKLRVKFCCVSKCKMVNFIVFFFM